MANLFPALKRRAIVGWSLRDKARVDTTAIKTSGLNNEMLSSLFKRTASAALGQYAVSSLSWHRPVQRMQETGSKTRAIFSRPFETCAMAKLFPALKRRAIVGWSLRDKARIDGPAIKTSGLDNEIFSSLF
jgi:hypothetical protein